MNPRWSRSRCSSRAWRCGGAPRARGRHDLNRYKIFLDEAPLPPLRSYQIDLIDCAMNAPTVDTRRYSMHITTKPGRVVAVLGALALAGAALAGCSSSGGSSGATTISLLAGGNDPAATKFAKDLAAGFHKANPSITVKVETRPGGTDGDNLVKTRLSTGDMNDVFLYNSGSLLQALHPDTTLQPLTDESWAKDLTSDFKKTVSTKNGLYG